MKLLLITTSLYPFSDANGHCILNIVDAMAKRGIQADILSYTALPMTNAPKYYNSHRIFYAYCPSFRPLSKAMGAFSFFIYAFIKVVAKIDNALSFKRRKSDINTSLYRAYSKKLRSILKECKYDAMITSLFPAEAVAAALKNRSKTPWYIYQLDAYADNHQLPSGHESNRIAMQNCFFSAAKAVFTTPLIFTTSQVQPYISMNKVISMEFPCVVERKCEYSHSPLNDEKGIRCAFVGTLNAEFRSPEYFVDLLAECQNDALKCHFYGIGQELVKQAKQYERAKNCLFCEGRVDREKAYAILNSVDFLINIDNDLDNQVPSKIFDYISTGKPIINIYYNNNSKSLPYFMKYPLVLNLRMDNAMLKENAKQLTSFIDEYYGKKVDFDLIRQLFEACTPEYVADKMIAAIMNTSNL